MLVGQQPLFLYRAHSNGSGKSGTATGVGRKSRQATKRLQRLRERRNIGLGSRDRSQRRRLTRLHLQQPRRFISAHKTIVAQQARLACRKLKKTVFHAADAIVVAPTVDFGGACGCKVGPLVG